MDNRNDDDRRSHDAARARPAREKNTRFGRWREPTLSTIQAHEMLSELNARQAAFAPPGGRGKAAAAHQRYLPEYISLIGWVAAREPINKTALYRLFESDFPCSLPTFGKRLVEASEDLGYLKVYGRGQAENGDLRDAMVELTPKGLVCLLHYRYFRDRSKKDGIERGLTLSTTNSSLFRSMEEKLSEQFEELVRVPDEDLCNAEKNPVQEN